MGKKIKEAGKLSWAHDEEADCTEFGNTCKLTGQYVDPNDEQATCKNCPLGFQVSVARSRCSVCSVGRFQDKLQQETCKECDQADELCRRVPGATSSKPRSAPSFLPVSSNAGIATTKNVARTNSSPSSSSSLSCTGSDSSENLDRKKTIAMTLYVLLFVLSASVVLMRELSCVYLCDK